MHTAYSGLFQSDTFTMFLLLSHGCKARGSIQFRRETASGQAVATAPTARVKV